MSPAAELKLPLLARKTAREDTTRQPIADAVGRKPKSELTTEKISVRHLNFFYEDGNQALRDVTVPIYDKRVTAFMGPSGCGKSTLLRVLNRMHDLYPGQRVEGEVLLDGEDILGDIDVYRLRTRIGMVFQKPTPFPMTVYDNIAFGIRLQRDVSKTEMDDLVEGALRRAALWDEIKDDLDRYAIEN
jgi:phosphate transport system ATP-binding protein